MNIDEKKLEKSQLEVTFELTAEEFNKYIDQALEHLQKHIKIDGFRKGQVPKEMVAKQVGQEALLMEAGDIAARKTYLKYINEKNLEPVGNPEISVVKIKNGEPFIFKAKFSVLPEIKLPNYREIVKSVKSKEVSVSDEEINHGLGHLQKSRAKMSLKNPEGLSEKGNFIHITYQNKDINQGKEIEDQFILGEGKLIEGFEDKIVGMKANEEKEFSVKFPGSVPDKNIAGKEGLFKVKMKSVYDLETPELSDEFAKQLGSFENIEALKNSIREGMTVEKIEGEKQRKRGEILEKISQKADFDMPKSIVESEKERLLQRFKNHITQNFKISFEEYLASIKKTENELKESYEKEAEKRLREYLILRQIGKDEQIEVSDEELDEEINKSIRGQNMDDVKKIDISELKEYTKGILFNEKVFQFLESLSQN